MSTVDLNWLLDDLSARVPEIEQVLMLSRDGLAVAASSGLRNEAAERLAALASGFQSLGRGTAEYLETPQVRQIIVEMSDKYLFIMAAGTNGALALVTSRNADMGLVAYEMTLLAKRVATLMPTVRRPLSNASRTT